MSLSKRLAAMAAVLAALTAALVGCTTTTPGGDSPQDNFGVESNPHYVNLPDGRKVLCVYEKTEYSSRSGGPSCDWDRAK